MSADLIIFLSFVVLLLLYAAYRRKKKKDCILCSPSFSGLDSAGNRTLVNIRPRYNESKMIIRGGDNGAIEEQPGGGIIVTGDTPIPGGGKAETKVWTFKGSMRNITQLKCLFVHFGKCYGIYDNGKTVLGFFSRRGSLDKGLLDTEVVDAEEKEDGRKAWTMQQVRGAGDCANHTFVRGATAGKTYALGIRMVDNGILKWAFKSWNGGARILECDNGKEMKGPGNWKVVGLMKGLGARKGMMTTISAVRPPECNNFLVGTCDMITGHGEVHRTLPHATVLGSLSGKTVRILGPSDFGELRKRFNIERTKHNEFGNSQEHAWTGALTIQWFFNSVTQADMIITGTYEMDAVFIVPCDLIHA